MAFGETKFAGPVVNEYAPVHEFLSFAQGGNFGTEGLVVFVQGTGVLSNDDFSIFSDHCGDDFIPVGDSEFNAVVMRVGVRRVDRRGIFTLGERCGIRFFRSGVDGFDRNGTGFFRGSVVPEIISRREVMGVW